MSHPSQDAFEHAGGRSMLMTFILRLTRLLGWLALAASVAVVLVVIGVELSAGIPAEYVLWPTPRSWTCFFNSLLIATGAMLMAFILSILPALAFLTARSRVLRSVLLALIVLPLLTLPSTFAYAWMLLATSRIPWIAAIIDALGWNQPGRQLLQAAWVLGAWLWPIPALTMILAFRHGALAAFQLASLDAPPLRAFLSAALPLLRVPMIASLTVVFLLSLTDNTVAPLMNATHVWSVEMLAQAAVAQRFERPVAYLLSQAWPMLALIALLFSIAAPGFRRMSRWAEDPDFGAVGSRRHSSTFIQFAALVLTALLTLMPIVVFCIELSTGRTSFMKTFTAVSHTLAASAMATLLVAAVAGVLAIAVALALLPRAGRFGARKTRSSSFSRRVIAFITDLVFILVIVTALLPPELIGTCLVTFFTRISDPSRWNLYDNTPWTWIAALLCRFTFIPLCVARLLDRSSPAALIDAASLDGASEIQQLRHSRLPFIIHGLTAAGIITACLCVSEAAVSVLVQPPRFFGGSLAVAIDAQMHYGRNNETILATLALMTPGLVTAVYLAWRGSQKYAVHGSGGRA